MQNICPPTVLDKVHQGGQTRGNLKRGTINEKYSHTHTNVYTVTQKGRKQLDGLGQSYCAAEDFALILRADSYIMANHNVNNPQGANYRLTKMLLILFPEIHGNSLENLNADIRALDSSSNFKT